MRQAYRNATSDAKRREIAEASHGITNVHDSRHAAWYARKTRRRVAAAPRPAAPVLDEDADHERAGTTEDS
jgi:hypothetical protein